MILSVALAVCGVSGADVTPEPGKTLEVQASVKVAAGKYVLPPVGEGGLRGAIRVEAVSGVVVDLSGVEIRGTNEGTDLDRGEGWGVVLVGCKDVTVIGGKIGGYRGCVVAQDCTGVVVDGVQFDGWYGKRLASNVAYEDGEDWLYPHHNDEGEWLKNYGAAVSLTNCRKVEVKECKGRHGQNGVLLTRCEGGEVWDCDFSFLSGWGLGMYRTSKMVVSHCMFDYCVRGYSDGVYWRGQDSAGILMFERCCENVFVMNSATHGGDGVFLFAGLDIVDEGNAYKRGEKEPGGSDRNVWWRNDLSYAVANSIEATFSRDNWAIGNALNGSHQHGVWGGYSSRMVVLGNSIEGTIGGGVSIEHGQENVVAENQIEGNEVGVELWCDENKALEEGPFGKNKETVSRDVWVYGNAFGRNGKDLVARKTSGLRMGGNGYDGTGEMKMEKVQFDTGGNRETKATRELGAWMTGRDGKTASGMVSESSVSVWDGREPEWARRAREWKCPEVKGKLQVYAKERGEKQGLATIVMGEWGPWDWRSGEVRPRAKQPGGMLKDVTWMATWWSWKDGVDPREREAEWKKGAEKPLVAKKVGNWVDPWGGDAEAKRIVGENKFGMVGLTDVEVKEKGKYKFSVVSDDGVRLKVDGKAVVENWTWHAPTRNEGVVELGVGMHRLDIEYFQIDGAWALSVEMVKAE